MLTNPRLHNRAMLSRVEPRLKCLLFLFGKTGVVKLRTRTLMLSLERSEKSCAIGFFRLLLNTSSIRLRLTRTSSKAALMHPKHVIPLIGPVGIEEARFRGAVGSFSRRCQQEELGCLGRILRRALVVWFFLFYFFACPMPPFNASTRATAM